jgi:hypothetical protein
MLSLDCHVLIDFDGPCRCKDRLPRKGKVGGQSQLVRVHPLAGAGMQALLDLRVPPKPGLQQQMDGGQVLRHLLKHHVLKTR